MTLPTLLACACELLQGGRPAELLALSTDSGSLEWAWLRRVAERRIAVPTEAWLDAFIRAWEDIGKPTDFHFARGRGLADAFAPVAAVMGTGGPDVAAGALVDLSSGGALVSILTVGWQPGGADALVLSALAAPSSESLLDRLWQIRLLDHRLASPPVRARALDELGRRWRALSQDFPDDFALAAQFALHEAEDARSPLYAELARKLQELAEECGSNVNIETLYEALVELRGDTCDRAACLADAVGLDPIPLIQISGRAKVLLEHDGPARDATVSMLRSLSRRFREASSIKDRLYAWHFASSAARATNDSDALREAESQLTVARRRLDARQRLWLDWPIEALQREIVEAIAYDEWGFCERTAFPSASNH